MFQIHKKPQGDAAVKKSVQKILDPKKDIVTRLKHLRLVLDNVTDPAEEQAIFEQYYSHIYYVFYENFLLAEANVRQKGAHRAQREELDGMLQIFETILVRLPEMLHERWQYNSIDRIIKTLLHPGNSLKMRRDGVKFFLLWFRALNVNAKESTILLYASIVPGFPSPPAKNELYSGCYIESLINPVPDNSQTGVCPAEITCLLPPPAGEKNPHDLTKFFLDIMLEYMVVEACKLQWKDRPKMETVCFSFLWNMFKKYYLPHIFDDFHFDTSVYQPNLSLPEPRGPVNYILNVTDTGSIDPCIEVGPGCPMLPARVSTIKWVIAFTSDALHNENKNRGARLPDRQAIGEADSKMAGGNSSGGSHEQEASHSNTSTLTEKAPSLSSLSSLDDKLKSTGSATDEEELVRNILYSTRENVNIVHEVFRQALMLPLTEAPTMRRVVKVYQEWIQDGITPIFMEEPDLSAMNDPTPVDNTVVNESDDEEEFSNPQRKTSSTSTSSLRNVSYMRGQLNPLLDQALSTYVQAGCQTTYQLFVTNSAHVFLVEPPDDAHKLIQAQVDVCKRVLNLYRHMVMHVNMNSTTWTQLLQVLLHITRIMLQDAETPKSIRVTTVAGRLAGPVFQTLIVSWIKANLFVHVSRELWDELVDVLSSLMHWKDLIVEWAKNMDTMTRVLARHVYGLELSDLPLDRLTEQKQMRNRKAALRERLAKPAEKSFSKGWSRESVPPNSGRSARMRSQTAIGDITESHVTDSRTTPALMVNGTKSDEIENNFSVDRRGRSVTVLGLEAAPETDRTLQNVPGLGGAPEHTGGHLPLKRGMSDSSNLSSSPPGTLTIGGKLDSNLQRSSSTSDISRDKIEDNYREHIHIEYNQPGRQRCNSGPGYREDMRVHGLRTQSSDNDGVTSLCSVEDAFNDMFDELAQQRLSTVNPKPVVAEVWNAPTDVISIKSQDSGSIDPNWNPWAESDAQTTAHDDSAEGQDQLYHETEAKRSDEYADAREEDYTSEWGNCLEDSNYDKENEDHSSAESDSESTSNDYDFSSTTGTLTLSGSCSMTHNIEIPRSDTNEQLNAFSSLPTTTRPTTLLFDKSTPSASSIILTEPTPPKIIWENLSQLIPKKSHSSPCTPAPYTQPIVIINKPPLNTSLRRAKSYLSYPANRRRPVRSISLPRQNLPRNLSSPSLALAPSHRTFPLTKLSSSRRVVEPVSSSNESFSCPIKITHSMQCFPCFSVDGIVPQHLAELTVNQNKEKDTIVNELASMLSKEQNTSSETASPGVSSPPYQLYKHVARDRYDSTALLIPDPRRDTSRNETRESIAEEEIPCNDSPDADTLFEKSSDDILGVHTSTPHITLSKGTSDLSGDESMDENNFQQDKTGDSILAPSEDCSILAGGRRTGWYPDVAVALWRRLLGILGDVNKVEDPVIHQLIFTYLLKFWKVLFKMRDNLGITTDNMSTPEPPQLVPPLRIMAPWAFKAVMSLPDSHKGGCLHAYQLLCNTTLQTHDTRLEPEHLALFYMILHEGLHSDQEQDKVNEIVESSSPRFFSCGLPASTLLLLDFIYACHAVAASTDLSGPRVEAQTLLGSVLCFPNLYYDLPVLNPDSKEPQALMCNNIKEYVADALLTSAKKEPSAPARCVALSSLGVWLYEELTSSVEEATATPTTVQSDGIVYDTNLSPVKGRILARHGRVKEAINVMLVSLKFNNRVVAGVACSQLHLLTHCIPQLLEYMPEMPSRIIEVMSLTASSLLQSSEAKSSDSGRQLLVSLLLCICDWCMLVPLDMLIEITTPGTDKRLIRTVFKALQTGALGKPGHSAKHSYSLSDLASKDFDPNLQLDKVSEGSSSSINGSGQMRNNKLPLPPMPNVSIGTDNVVSLTASTVLSHLTNHLGHFPLAKGPAVLNSMVTEQQDHGMDNKNLSADLSNNLFSSPNVQFLIYNDSCLLSMVEINAQKDVPGGGPTAGLSTAPTNVRLIIRDTSGKFCWDSSILYGLPDLENHTKPVSHVPLSTLDVEISKVISEHCSSYISYAESEIKKKTKVKETPLPSHDVSLPSEQSSDKLDQLVQYVGYSSPECQEFPGRPLNIPASPSRVLDDTKLQGKALEYILKQHKSQSTYYSSNAHHTSCQSRSVRPLTYSPPQPSFHQSRLLISQTAFLSKENRRRVTLLKKNERLLRELKNLDSRHCRETHKVAVLYIAPGQEDKLSVLSNTAGSKDFENFVCGLGWEVDLKTHCGFRGKLHADGSTGSTSPYYATSTLEVVFHVSTRFPSTNDDSRNIKLKHLGNDEVHIVWSEHSRDYRRGIIPTEFGDVLIIIYPMKHMLYRIQIKKKDEVPYFGPLFDGAIVNARVLPVLVRETAINAGRAKRSQISLYQPFYEERAKYLRQIIDQFRDDTTFEDYAAQLFSPGTARNLSPAAKLVPKRPAPKPSPPLPASEMPQAQSTPMPPTFVSQPSPIVGKVLPLAAQQPFSVANSNNNNSGIQSSVIHEVTSNRRRHVSTDSDTSVQSNVSTNIPPIKEVPNIEEFDGGKGARYTPGHQVSSNRAVSNPSPTPPVHKSSASHLLISTPRPKPSASSHPTSISALSFSQNQQQTPVYPTSIDASTKIHIPVSKLHPTLSKSSNQQSTQNSFFKRHSASSVKTSSATNSGIILVPPPPTTTKSVQRDVINRSLSSPASPTKPFFQVTYQDHAI
uniref:ral GTPase-activating protein subunit alpha-1-like isoform X2 n=1 Tax=Styela clava TaxID=7725 RepID=UPI00193A3642|nr:ral GTPase-activating protein subunit alpha-1-like isoform X2 [Styela clava]